MNVIQASILNNYCEEHPEVLVVFVQANNSLSVYYKNKNNKIAHKFGSLIRSSELIAEQVWVSLQNFEDSYKDLLKYFHPDTYKGKRKNYELTETVNCIISIRRCKQNYKKREFHELLVSIFKGPQPELSRELYGRCSYVKLLGSGDLLITLSNWIEGIRWAYVHKQKTSWVEEFL